MAHVSHFINLINIDHPQYSSRRWTMAIQKENSLGGQSRTWTQNAVLFAALFDKKTLRASLNPNTSIVASMNEANQHARTQVSLTASTLMISC